MYNSLINLFQLFPSDIFFFQYLFIWSILAFLIILIIPDKYSLLIKQFSLLLSLKIFLISLILYKLLFVIYESHNVYSSFLKIYTIIEIFGNKIPFCCDSISLLLIVLTTFLTFICIALSLELSNFKLFSLCFFFMEFLLLVVWTVFDIFLFYIFFESVLIPMFVIINFWGSRPRKARASYLFFMYTVIGSLPMLFAIIYIYLKTGTTNIFVLQLINLFSFAEQKWLWLAFFLAFAVKVPMIPFHLWLPEAHVEAPTSGSVILAGVLLKLGSYGMLRFLNPLFSFAGLYYTPLVHTLSVCGIVYASLTALRQNDLKRVIAYASIAHMNLIVVGIFSLSIYAFQGAVFQMISHGLVSSLLFLMVGILYDRSATRLIVNYSGLAIIMPTFATYFLFAIIANMAFPGTSSFIGEMLLFFGIFLVNVNIGYLSAVGIFLCSTYSIWLYNRIMFGNLSIETSSYTDVDNLDLFIIQILLFVILVFGFYPHFVTNFIYFDIVYLLLINN
jgi:proton-translocating NADH-quinone oxidoreductase chain M